MFWIQMIAQLICLFVIFCVLMLGSVTKWTVTEICLNPLLIANQTGTSSNSYSLTPTLLPEPSASSQ
jgi:hypothetical protein